MEPKPKAPEESKKGLTLGKTIIGFFVFIFLLIGFVHFQSETAISNGVENDVKKISEIRDFVANNESTDTRYIFDSERHLREIDVDLIEQSPAIDLIKQGTTFDSTTMRDAYTSIERVASIKSGDRVLFFKEENGVSPWQDMKFSLIKFTDVNGKENAGWIDSKYLFSKSDYESLLAKYLQSPEGKICSKYEEWSSEDCLKVARNITWLGMSLDMLKEERGLPTSANPSNYGSGVRWQWCWYGESPSCFYDDNNDMLVDSYN